MPTLAEFILPPDAFSLGVVFDAFPRAAVELECVVPTAGATRQYFWVENAPADAVATALEARADIGRVTRVDQLPDRTLFRYRSDRGDHCPVVAALTESDTTLLSARGTCDGWLVTVRGDEQHAIAAFDEACRTASMQPTLRDLRSDSVRTEHRQPGLTDAQREALVLAYENGYYAEPRETDLATLAAEVGISRQAFARRLSRGYRTLIESHLCGEGDKRVS